MSHNPYDPDSTYSPRNYLAYILETLNGTASSTVFTSPETARVSDSGSTSSSYDYIRIGQDESWDVQSVFARIDNTDNSESLDYRIVGTSIDSPTDPNNDISDWYVIRSEQTLGSGSTINFHETVHAEQVAFGVKNGSGSADFDREFVASSQSALVELIQVLGEEASGAAGYDSDGSINAQIREVVKTLGDDDNASAAGYNQAGTLLQELVQLQKAQGDETASGPGDVPADQTSAQTNIQALKLLQELLRSVMQGEIGDDQIQTVQQIQSNRTSDTVTTSSLPTYVTLGPGTGDDWQIQSIMADLTETGGESASYLILVTGESSPTDPNTSTNDWEIPDSDEAGGTLSSDENITVRIPTDAEQIAFGYANNSGQATIEYEIEVRADDNLVETNRRLGPIDDSAAGYNSSGSVVAQAREIVKTLGDDQNASAAGYNQAGTLLAELIQMQKALGDETASGGGEAVQDPTVSQTLIQSRKGTNARLRDDLGEEQDSAATYDSNGSLISQNRQTQKALGDETASGDQVVDPTTNSTNIQALKGLLQRLRDDLGEDSNLAAGYDADGSLVSQARQLSVALGNPGASGSSATQTNPQSNGDILQKIGGLMEGLGLSSTNATTAIGSRSDTAAGYDNNGTLIAQAREIVDVLGDDDTIDQDQLDPTAAQTILEAVTGRNRQALNLAFKEGSTIISGTGSEQNVALTDPFGDLITETISSGTTSDEDYIDVRSHSHFSLRVDLGSSSSIIKVYGRKNEDADDETLVDQNISSGLLTDVTTEQNIEEYSWLRVTENSSGSDHDIWFFSTSAGLPALGNTDDSASGYNANGSLISQTRQLSKTLGDETEDGTSAVETDPQTGNDLLTKFNGYMESLGLSSSNSDTVLGARGDGANTDETGNGTILSFIKGFTGLLDDAVLSAQNIIRTGTHVNQVSTNAFTTTSSFSLIDDGSNTAQILATEQTNPDIGYTSVVGVVENTDGQSNSNAIEAKMQGRFNDGSFQSSWIDVTDPVSVSADSAEGFRPSSSASADLDEYRLVVQDGSGGSNDVRGALTVKGS